LFWHNCWEVVKEEGVTCPGSRLGKANGIVCSRSCSCPSCARTSCLWTQKRRIEVAENKVVATAMVFFYFCLWLCEAENCVNSSCGSGCWLDLECLCITEWRKSNMDLTREYHYSSHERTIISATNVTVSQCPWRQCDGSIGCIFEISWNTIDKSFQGFSRSNNHTIAEIKTMLL